MSPVDVGPEFSLFWLAVFGLPLLALVGIVVWERGWLGTLTEGRLSRLLAKAEAWEEKLAAKRPPLLTKAVTDEQQRQLASLELALASNTISKTDYERYRADVLKEHA